MTIDATTSPQLARMEEVQDESQMVYNFIEWLGQHGMAICTTEDGLRGTRFFPVMESAEALLARYFGIDLNAVERERRAVLAAFQQTQAERASAA